MSPEDRDQANAALLLDEKIQDRIAEALLEMLGTTPVQSLPMFPNGDKIVHALMSHPAVQTTIYVKAAETARLLILQAFQEYAQRSYVPTQTYYTSATPAAPTGYVFSASALPKQPFF